MCFADDIEGRVMGYDADGPAPEIVETLIEKLNKVKYEFNERRKKSHDWDPEKKCGAMVVVGYSPDSHSEYIKYLNEDVIGPVYKQNPERTHISNPEALDLLMTAATETDGAILMDTEGYLLASGYVITNLSLDDIAVEMGRPNSRPLWQRYNFSSKVGTKHCSAAAGSYVMPDVYIVTMSEQKEDPVIRVLKQGQIVSSPYDRELSPPLENLIHI